MASKEKASKNLANAEVKYKEYQVKSAEAAKKAEKQMKEAAAKAKKKAIEQAAKEKKQLERKIMDLQKSTKEIEKQKKE